jgi:hypothetical protein
MMRRSGSTIAVWLLALQAPAALACGYCVEDRIAATYDFSVVSGALDQRHEVAFFVIQGAGGANGMSGAAISRLLEGTKGIDRNSVRVSVDAASLSFAFDPARAPLGPILIAADGKLHSKGLSLALLRVLDHASYAKPAPVAVR